MLTFYIFAFALIFLYLYWQVHPSYRSVLILAANFITLALFSLFGTGSLSLVFYIFIAALIYLCANFVSRFNPVTQRRERRGVLFIATCVSLAPLIYFKIFHLSIPIGLSYFSFILLGYFLDVYRKPDTPHRSIRDFLTFSSFFPVLAMGPIERTHQLAPQLRNPENWNHKRAIEGLFLVALGIFKKFVIADRLLEYTVDSNHAVLNDTGFSLWIFCILSFIQIFCDFSGLIDIVRGYAKLLGIEVMKNFDQPYFAPSIPEIWRRWHISLVNWVRDFVYNPIALKTQNLYLASFAVMLIVGLWHSVSWNGLLWAFYWSSLYAVSIFMRKRNWKTPLPKVLKVLGVFLLMSLSTIAFLPQTLHELTQLAGQLFNFDHPLAFSPNRLSAIDLKISLLAFVAIVAIETTHLRAKKLKSSFEGILAILLILATVAWGIGDSKAFVYLRY